MDDFKKAYKLPLLIDENGPYIWTSNNTMAFNYGNPAIAEPMVKKINGEDVPELDKLKPFTRSGLFVQDSLSRKQLFVRGWGFLTGVGGLHLKPADAIKLQNAFIDYCVEQLNR